MAKQSLPTNSMSILNFNVLVAGDNEGMLEKIQFPFFQILSKSYLSLSAIYVIPGIKL